VPPAAVHETEPKAKTELAGYPDLSFDLEIDHSPAVFKLAETALHGQGKPMEIAISVPVGPPAAPLGVRPAGKKDETKGDDDDSSDDNHLFRHDFFTSN
jgi:hypothetical protein